MRKLEKQKLDCYEKEKKYTVVSIEEKKKGILHPELPMLPALTSASPTRFSYVLLNDWYVSVQRIFSLDSPPMSD